MSCWAEPAIPASVPETSGCPICLGFHLKNISAYHGKQLKQCLDCRVCFVLPQPSPASVTAHFAEDRLERDYFEDYRFEADRFEADRSENHHPAGEDHLTSKFETNREEVLSRVAACIQRQKKTGTILDVGCATGIFLAHFFQSPAWHAWGVELSPTAAARASSRGLKVCLGDTRTARFADSLFDVITVLDTFYYFPQPQVELSEFHRVLKGNGLLVLELPWAASRIWRTSAVLGRLLSHTRRPLLESSDHLYYYDPKSISLLLKRTGFRMQAIVPLPGNRQASRFLDAAYKTYSFLSSTAYSASASRLFLGPRFLVVAVKQSP
jgi:SAM-dependent methyltransferase